ncbi:arylsulfatase A-like enzyme [Rhodococcus sp. OK611]|uniref:sulfatase-like hydrolase/transferase n=1 Tax=unclassified Rhodococcus (in: high G+C Gram-positive bacteria) TaxID=192944 RepID=UPI000BDCC1A2|nr:MULTISPECIES: sulfatase-like hydrolase/transferase [unclassified Rhodococcus (in: high G+C Gram-positive bacteria)]PTR37488.1 arylsulfatase A-like enzyme [Rhodococcus sp. OK611]SNX93394.1 Arylsulfatase A [Rhodococcus sp. OK270]
MEPQTESTRRANESPQCSDGSAGFSTATTRRTFLGAAGALVAAGVAGIGSTGPRASAAQGSDVPIHRPNIVVIITDQERHPMHWPAGWADANLPNRKRLASHGLSFTRSFCNTAMCSPSRSTFFTGLYPAQHGVTATLTEGGTVSPNEPQLQVGEQNMARVLESAGYTVHYRGKWHMSKGAAGGDPSSADIAAYGFQGWVPPEGGQDTNPDHFGGGCADIDQRIANEAVEFIGGQAADGDGAFALIVSFINPHDVLAYPQTWDALNGTCNNYGTEATQAFNQGITLPPSVDEMLARGHKPTAQIQSQLLLAAGLGPLIGPQAAQNYVNFYAYMHKVVDDHIGAVLDALEAEPGLIDRTVIVRMSDHGEMGLSHGGLRQKIFNAYEETLRVPLVISNPAMFPRPVQTDAMASLIDVVPTLATLAGADPAAWRFLGTDLMPVVADAAAHPDNPTAAVQDSILFTYDDQNCATPDGQFIVTQPNHIRCVRDTRWKYSAYFDPAGVASPQYELYDLVEDPLEMHNRANPLSVGYYAPEQAAAMHTELFAAMARTGTTPARGL